MLNLLSPKGAQRDHSGINSTSSPSSFFALNYSSSAAAAAFYMTNTQQPSRSLREILEESSTSDAGLRYQSGGRVTLPRSQSRSRLDNSSFQIRALASLLVSRMLNQTCSACCQMDASAEFIQTAFLS